MHTNQALILNQQSCKLFLVILTCIFMTVYNALSTIHRAGQSPVCCAECIIYRAEQS